jgi:hypothetical protein
MRLARLSLLAIVPILVIVIVSSSGSAGAKKAASGKAYSAKISYVETNHGTDHKGATTGIEGHGAGSGHLGAAAAVISAFVSLATGVPLNKIAQGGTYKLRHDISAKGVATGLVVVKFKVHGLGTVCAKYTERLGKYVPGKSFVPMSGTISTVGGTGAAAKWRLTVGFKQTGISGTEAKEGFAAGGSEHASLGKARGLTAACKRVAKIH